jgi:hypothetical protein
MELIPRLLLLIIVEKKEELRGATAPESEWLPAPLIRVALRGDKAAAPQDGRGSVRPSTKASGPPAVDASNTIAVDVLGLPSAEVVGLRSPTSATAVTLSSWPRTGRSETTTSGGTSTIPMSEATGGSAGESATAPTGVDAGASNRSRGLGARPRQQSPPARWPPRQRGRPGGLAPWQLVPPGPPARGRFVRRPANQHGASRRRLRRPAPS